MTTRRAMCSCGKVQVACDGDPVRVSMCHCLECQRRTGSVFSSQAWFSREQTTFTGNTTHFTSNPIAVVQ